MNIKNVLFCCFLQTPLTGEYVFRKPTFSLVVVEQEMDIPGLPLNWQLVCRQMSSPGVLIIWRLPYICSFISLSTLLTNIFARADSFADAIEVPEWYFLDVNYFTKNKQQKQNILLQDSFCFPVCMFSFFSFHQTGCSSWTPSKVIKRSCQDVFFFLAAVILQPESEETLIIWVRIGLPWLPGSPFNMAGCSLGQTTLWCKLNLICLKY